MYALLLDDGKLIEDPEWRCPADVIASFHGFFVSRVYGTLVRWDRHSSTWQPVNHER